MVKICGSAGPGGQFCSKKIGHLGECLLVGLELKCEPVKKRKHEPAPQDSTTIAAAKKSPKAAAPSRPAAAEMTTPAPKPVIAASKDKSVVKTKLAAKPKATKAVRPVKVCATPRPLGLQGTWPSFCTKEYGHLGNCFEKD